MFAPQTDKTKILQDLCAKRSCIVEAGPGTGKTYFMLQAAALDESPCLVLAYNKMLAAHLEALMPLNAQVFTFHGLCSTYLAPARDDDQLAAALDAADRGEVLSTFKGQPFARVCVDEAQDVRPEYVELLHACNLVDANTVFLIGGDRNQLIYDFDDDYPASLEFMLNPSTLIPSVKNWERHELTLSHRLSQNVCLAVNHIFGTSLVSARDDVQKIDVRIPSSIWSAYESLKDILQKEESVLLLTTERRSRSLCTLLSASSRDGHEVVVHHFDEDKSDGFKGIRAGTYWSAKGVEAQCVIVMTDARCARNATYVALTRASRRLVVVLDPDSPNAALASAIEALPQSFDVQGRASALLNAKFTVATSLTSRPRVAYSGLKNATRARLSRAAMHKLGVTRDGGVEGVPRSAAGRADEQSRAPTVKNAVLRAMLLLQEHKTTGAVRWLRDIIDPVKMEWSDLDECIKLGFARRTVAPRTPLDKLLAPDLLELVLGVEARLMAAGRLTRADAVVLALASFAFNGFDHAMRRYVDQVEDAVREHALDFDWVEGVLDARAFSAYDVPLVKQEAWARVDGTGEGACLMLVWELTKAEEAAAAVRASLHPRNKCCVVAVDARAVHGVSVTDPASLLAEL